MTPVECTLCSRCAGARQVIGTLDAGLRQRSHGTAPLWVIGLTPTDNNTRFGIPFSTGTNGGNRIRTLLRDVGIEPRSVGYAYVCGCLGVHNPIDKAEAMKCLTKNLGLLSWMTCYEMRLGRPSDIIFVAESEEEEAALGPMIDLVRGVSRRHILLRTDQDCTEALRAWATHGTSTETGSPKERSRGGSNAARKRTCRSGKGSRG